VQGDVVPEYLSPGVYIEEVPFRSKPIEGVSTSTAGFVGPTRFGPIGTKPCVITSLQEFERIYGDGGQLVFADSCQMHNYMWHAVRAFFAEGGRRLYVARVFEPRRSDDDGVASCSLPADGGAASLGLRARFPGAAGDFLVRFTVRPGADDIALTVLFNDGSVRVWDHLPPDPARLLAIVDTFGDTLPLTITPGDGVTNGADVVNALCAAKPSLRAALDDPHSTESDRSVDVLLAGGSDGARPTSTVYQGSHNLPAKAGLQALEDVEEISIVAAPGATFGYLGEYQEKADRIMEHLIAHAERMRHRIAVLDSGDGLDASEVRAMRAKVDSKSAALYYPWVRTRDPISGTDIDLPPSGFVAGLYSRNDAEKGVSKAPANLVVNLAIGLENLLSDAEQDGLNAEGIDCLRTFAGRGVLVWGARTISSDPEWKYVNVRRYFAYLERSIYRGMQWTVFEPHGEALCAAVRRSIESFLLNEWRTGALKGNKPEMAFFVRCDQSTMTQDDVDKGRLICLIGVAPVRPAEFVIVRIGQWTADRKR
jgi:phage tail sheath protein FI